MSVSEKGTQMKGSELRRLVETHDHDGVFDVESAARELKEKDVHHFEAVRTLVILADTERTLDAFDFIDDSSKCATEWGWTFEYNKSSYDDVKEMLSVRPEVVIQLVKRLYNL